MHPEIIFLFLSVGAVSLFSFIAVAAWSDNRRREREAFYRSETLKKIAETQGAGGATALEIMREHERIADKRRREGLMLGGLICVAVGVGVAIFLYAVARNEPVFLAGVIPLLVGVALLVHVNFLRPKE